MVKIAADDDAGAAEFAQDVGHHFVVAGQLVVQPDVLDGQAELFEQVENQLQFGIDQRFAGDAPVKDGHAQDRFAVEDGHGHLGAQQFEFLLRFRVVAGLVAVAPQNAAEPEELAADAGFEREFEMLQQARRTDRWRRRRAGGGFRPAERRLQRELEGLAQENRRAVDAEDFAQQQQELLEHALGIERMGQDAGKIAQDTQGLGRARMGAGAV